MQRSSYNYQRRQKKRAKIIILIRKALFQYAIYEAENQYYHNLNNELYHSVKWIHEIEFPIFIKFHWLHIVLHWISMTKKVNWKITIRYKFDDDDMEYFDVNVFSLLLEYHKKDSLLFVVMKNSKMINEIKKTYPNLNYVWRLKIILFLLFYLK